MFDRSDDPTRPLRAFAVAAAILASALAATPALASHDEVRVARGTYEGLVNGVELSIAVTAYGYPDGRIEGELTGVSREEYSAVAVWMAQGVCRIFAKAEPGAVNMAQLSTGPVVTYTAMAFTGGAGAGPNPVGPTGELKKTNPIGPFEYELTQAGYGFSPAVLPEDTIEFPDYTETWRQVGPGLVSMQQSRQVIVNGEIVSYERNTLASYDPTGAALPGTQVRLTRDISVTYDEATEVMRVVGYASVALAEDEPSVDVGPLADQDPSNGVARTSPLEPNTPWDAPDLMWSEPPPAYGDRVYLDVRLARIDRAGGIAHLEAYLAFWRDCNGDGRFGSVFTGAHAYPSELLVDDSVCPAGGGHNDGTTVRELFHIGPGSRDVNDAAAEVWVRAQGEGARALPLAFDPDAIGAKWRGSVPLSTIATADGFTPRLSSSASVSDAAILGFGTSPDSALPGGGAWHYDGHRAYRLADVDCLDDVGVATFGPQVPALTDCERQQGTW